jgi:hypothetical protein
MVLRGPNLAQGGFDQTQVQIGVGIGPFKVLHAVGDDFGGDDGIAFGVMQAVFWKSLAGDHSQGLCSTVKRP